MQKLEFNSLYPFISTAQNGNQAKFTSPNQIRAINPDVEVSTYDSSVSPAFMYTPQRQPKVFPQTSLAPKQYGLMLDQTGPSRFLEFFSPQHPSIALGGGKTVLYPSQFATTNVSNNNFSSPQRDHYSDRFIPCRTDSVSKKLFSLKGMQDQGGIGGFGSKQNAGGADESLNSSMVIEKDDNERQYNSMLQKQLLEIDPNTMNFLDSGQKLSGQNGNQNANGANLQTNQFSSQYKKQANLLRFQTENQSVSSASSSCCNHSSYLLNFSPGPDAEPPQPQRKIATTPFQVLDAPGLTDDYYLDLLDWSSQNKIVVALNNSVYTWNYDDSKITLIASCPESQSEAPSSYFTALHWNPSGSVLSIGTRTGFVELWDAEKQVMFKKYENHTHRVGSINWANNNIFASGSKDKSILVTDIRSNDRVLKFKTAQEVCGLSWSFDEYHLAAGCNDNKVMIYNGQKGLEEHVFKQHKAAVRALAWSPHNHNLLLTGGGAKDQTIKFWNVSSMSLINSLNVDSQVCKLRFSKTSNEFVSTHGYDQNQVMIWKYPNLSKIAVLEGHQARVLYLAASPDGQTICTGAGDQTLKFWKVFPQSQRDQTSTLLKAVDLR